MSEGFSSSSTEAESKFSAHVDLLQFKQGILCIRGALLIVWSNKQKMFYVSRETHLANARLQNNQSAN